MPISLNSNTPLRRRLEMAVTDVCDHQGIRTAIYRRWRPYLGERGQGKFPALTKHGVIVQ